MAIREPLLSSISVSLHQVLFLRLTLFPELLLQFSRQDGLRSTLKNWEKTLKMIDVVLINAEEKQLTHHHHQPLKIWLNNLRRLTNDMEKIVGEFVTEALRRKSMTKHQPSSSSSSSSKVQKFISAVFVSLSPTAIKFNASMKKKMKKNTSFLEVLCKQMNELGLEKLLDEVYNENCSNLTAIQKVNFFSVSKILYIENYNALMSLSEGLMQHEYAHIQHLRIAGCHNLTFIFKSQLPSSLKKLVVESCGKLQYLFDDDTRASINNTGLSSLEHLNVSSCPSLTRLSSRMEQLSVLKHLVILECLKLVTLSSSGQLPETLQNLRVSGCPNLKSIAESFQSNMSLEYIKILKCEELKLLPGNLNSLSRLCLIYVWDCPSLVSFPEGGLPHTNLRLVSLKECRKLKALPENMHKLNSLQELELWHCTSITSIEKEGLPTSLTSLSIMDLGFNRSLAEWGLPNLTSLKKLQIVGCVYAESFPQDYAGLVLPTSLTSLTIIRFPRLKYLSSLGLQNLEYLSIINCPALTSLPESGLPPSLVLLYIHDCPLLKKRCKKNEGEEWFKISGIPHIEIK